MKIREALNYRTDPSKRGSVLDEAANESNCLRENDYQSDQGDEAGQDGKDDFRAFAGYLGRDRFYVFGPFGFHCEPGRRNDEQRGESSDRRQNSRDTVARCGEEFIHFVTFHFIDYFIYCLYRICRSGQTLSAIYPENV